MSSHQFSTPICSIVISLLLGLLAIPSVPAQDIAKLIDPFSPCDINDDGVDEIVSLKWVTKWSETDLQPTDRVLIVLVEDRLLTNESQAKESELSQAIGHYCRCLAQDGWKPIAIRALVYDGKIHQDGRTLLAIRRFFKTTQTAFPNFGGATLIGSFPESMLVRRWVWKHGSRSATFNGVTYNKGKGPKATFVALDPELISHRSDVVLCDLDGHWEDIYVQPPTEIDQIKFLPDEEITAMESWPTFEQTITTNKFSIRPKTFEDFFFIDDAKFQILDRSEKSLTLQCDYDMRRPEVGLDDRDTANPLAVPDIMVSRINTRHVAVVQPASNLDATGKPCPVPESGGSPNRQFARDARFERQLLVEYLRRNIEHRNGQIPAEARRVASMWTDLQTPSKRYFAKVSKELNGTKSFPKADAVDFVRFMKTSAILKGISAHSNPGCSVLMKGYDQQELLDETGGHYWFWKKSGQQFVPSYDHSNVRDRVHFSLLRTLWENAKLESSGSSFYIHGGCEAISPQGAATHAYNSTAYGGHQQIAESLLFFGNGLALIGRSKVYFDIPRGFDQSFGVKRGNFGDILTKYFEIEANDAKLASSVASRNRTYFWNIIGDWTLKLTYPPAASPASHKDRRGPHHSGPYVIRSERFEWIDNQIKSGNPSMKQALDRLIAEAETALKKDVVSVVDNDVVPPSGDLHDYMSFGPYWWPNPETEDGLPYIRRDGQVNPESRENGSDRAVLNELVKTVETLAVAYRITGDERFAKQAVDFLTAFFLDRESRMNPNLNFGQAIPGRCEGRDIGIIDTRNLSRVVDAICLIQSSQHLDQAKFAGLQNWFRQYLDWLRTSQHGISENAKKNNHGTYYDVQVMALALFTNQIDIAREVAERAVQKRIKSQVAAGGQQPEELARTKSYSYSLMNLHGMFLMARLAEHVDVDLWNVTLSSEPSPALKVAYQFLEPHFHSLQSWNYKQLSRSQTPRLPYYLILEASRIYAPDNPLDWQDALSQLENMLTLLR